MRTSSGKSGTLRSSCGRGGGSLTRIALGQGFRNMLCGFGGLWYVCLFYGWCVCGVVWLRQKTQKSTLEVPKSCYSDKQRHPRSTTSCRIATVPDRNHSIPQPLRTVNRIPYRNRSVPLAEFRTAIPLTEFRTVSKSEARAPEGQHVMIL